MNQPSANPYASPNADSSTSIELPRNRQLVPLWIWLAIALVTSLLGTPADPISMLVALAYGLISFSMGAILGSPLNMIVRVIPAVLWLIPAVPLALLNGGPYFIIGALGYLMASFALGAWTSHRTKYGRIRIFLCFAVGFVLGSIVGPLGTVAGAVLGTVLAQRSLPNLKDGSVDQRTCS